jgi:hypothetical protein
LTSDYSAQDENTTEKTEAPYPPSGSGAFLEISLIDVLHTTGLMALKGKKRMRNGQTK